MATEECRESPKRHLEPCGCLPPGFSRLRYFFGKRLGAADLTDEQRYHAGKQRFHNQRLHGAGVLCGLRLFRREQDGTLVSVGKGAALDRCGREIVVGVDQCIDVNAWYRAKRLRRKEKEPDWPAKELTTDGKLPLCVLLRYAECSGHPEPAPRDPCSCAEGGCEFGRVSEEFELKLVTESEAQALVIPESFPTPAQIAEALADPAGSADIVSRLAAAVVEGCPPAVEQTWLRLGCFTAGLDDDGQESVVSVAEPAGPVPAVLLSSEVIQYLLSKLWARYSDLETDDDAPEIIRVEWLKVPGKPKTYRAILHLSWGVEAATIDRGDSFGLRKLTDGGWDPPPPNTVEWRYDESNDPAILVDIENVKEFLEDGARYQLYVNPAANPVVDSNLRRLRPHDFVWSFRLTTDSGTGELKTEPPPFSP